MKKIVTIIGARPQFIKAAVVSRAFKAKSNIQEVLIHTGQHHDASMSDVFFDEMRIPKPDYNLGVAGLSHGAMTGRMLEKIEEVLLKEKPNWVLVYGDTNSTLAGALAAAKLHIPVAHVEAGLRSFNMKMPEEINRILTDRVSTLLFCPSDAAVKNLQNEGVTKGVIRTGDVMADALYYYQKIACVEAKLFKTPPAQPYTLATLHRAENTDDPVRLKKIISALEIVNIETPVYLPLHPRTKGKLKDLGLNPKINIIDPVGYYDMLQLLKGCSIVLTDSGGLQKEAYLSQKPCVTFRNETEWVELVETGVNMVVGTETDAIVSAVKAFKHSGVKFPEALYGNGKAGEKIVEAMLV
ncbi:MAG: non-hydrolyzing UDP-N-acetylglucosamine 2-epimerase [Bacteriovoracia bacterium]